MSRKTVEQSAQFLLFVIITADIIRNGDEEKLGVGTDFLVSCNDLGIVAAESFFIVSVVIVINVLH